MTVGSAVSLRRGFRFFRVLRKWTFDQRLELAAIRFKAFR